MKRLFILSTAIIILLLSACSYTEQVSDVPSNTEITEAEGLIPQTTPSISTQLTEANTETAAAVTEEVPVESVSQVTETTPNNTEIPTETIGAIEVKVEDPTTAIETVDGVSVTDLAPTTPMVIKATASDSAEIADRIVAYINEYRYEAGSCNATNLPGLAKYAEYRSKQLVTNFNHDTLDERAAATALQYGQYIQPELYGISGEPYYTANAREAIFKTTFGGTVDAVAKHIAQMARNSADHWSYVGNPEYSYIAVGITYESGTWYCCLAVSTVNTDNN